MHASGERNKARYTLSLKTFTFYFLNNCQKLTDINVFATFESLENFTDFYVI